MEITRNKITTQSSWILSDFRFDFLWLYFPGLLFILLSQLITEQIHPRLFGFYFFLDACFLGSGHIYITQLRTYLNPQEFRRSFIYILAPLICFSIFFSWRYFSITWFVYLPAYMQFIHYVQQSFGIQKWYQRKNLLFHKGSDFFIRFLSGMPFIIFHFRPKTDLTSLFLNDDLLLHPDPVILKILLALYAFGIFAWIVYETFFIRTFEWNRISYIFISTFMNGVCFCLGRNEAEIIFPLVAYHGLAYFVLMNHALLRTRSQIFTPRRSFFCLVLVALLFGAYERMIEFIPGEGSKLLGAIWAGIYVTPIMLHYIYDAILWRSKHAEGKLVYGSA